MPFGKLFRLDGCFMTSERDEFFYHENLVHVAAVTHPQPERALIVGGGDGGSAEEILKHPSIKSVTLAEIDLAVVDISRKYLQQRPPRRAGRSAPHAQDRGRLRVRAARTTSNTTSSCSISPIRADRRQSLYTTDFYRACAARLSPMGAMTLHIASPVAHPERIRATLASLRTRVRDGVAVSHVGPAVRRHVDDGVLLGDARSAQHDAAAGGPRGSRSAVLPTCSTTTATPIVPAFALPNFVRALVA